MARRIAAVVTRALTARTITSEFSTDPHFHQGAQGNAAACFDTHCDRPRLEV